jgi:hypothetical protein
LIWKDDNPQLHVICRSENPQMSQIADDLPFICDIRGRLLWLRTTATLRFAAFQESERDDRHIAIWVSAARFAGEFPRKAKGRASLRRRTARLFMDSEMSVDQ